MIPALIDPSPDALLTKRLVNSLGQEGARRAHASMVAQFTNVELAALAAYWPAWARPKQLAPLHEWRTWGNLTARGWGKTLSIAHFIIGEVQAGRAGVIIMAAQNLTKTESIQVAGLIAASPPWFMPEYESSREQLVWPNGARAYAFTPEVPEALRSPNAHLAWLSEVQSWPAATREEAYSNFKFATRVGYARTVWDATPKRAHPILKRLIAASAADPLHHVIVRGTIYENPHLGRGVVEDMEREYGGTRKGREELLGEMLDESESALVKQAWIDDHRRAMPDRLRRRVIAVDPALTKRKGNDNTGLIEAGIGFDDQLYVLADHTAKLSPSEWAEIVLDRYVRNRCDLVIVERNAGGDYVESNLRSFADRRELNVQKVGENDRPSHVAGTVFVREMHARGSKEDRAQPLSTAYERGRVSHVIGAKLAALEETLTTWEPAVGQSSPDALDALVHAATDLLGLLDNRVDPKAGFRGYSAAAASVSGPSTTPNLTRLLGGRSGVGRI